MEVFMSDKVKKIIKGILLAVLIVWLLVITWFAYIAYDHAVTELNKPAVDENILALQARVTALEMGSTWDNMVEANITTAEAAAE